MELDYPHAPNILREDSQIESSHASIIPPFPPCEVNCTSKGFTCNFLDLTMNQSPPSIFLCFVIKMANHG